MRNGSPWPYYVWSASGTWISVTWLHHQPISSPSGYLDLLGQFWRRKCKLLVTAPGPLYSPISSPSKKQLDAWDGIGGWSGNGPRLSVPGSVIEARAKGIGVTYAHSTSAQQLSEQKNEVEIKRHEKTLAKHAKNTSPVVTISCIDGIWLKPPSTTQRQRTKHRHLKTTKTTILNFQDKTKIQTYDTRRKPSKLITRT